MVQIIPRHKKGPSTSQQFGEAFSRAAVATSQHLYEKEQREKQQENVSNFLENEYGIKNSKNLPQEFQMAAMKGAQSKQNKLAGKATQDEQLRINDTVARALRGEATPEEEASLPFEQQLKISKERRENAKEPSKRLSEKPIDPQQKEALNKARSVEGFNNMDEVSQYRTMIDNDVSPELAEKESKLSAGLLERNQKSADSSYKAQEDFINQTTDKYRAYETDTKPRLMQLQKIANDDQLIGPTSAAFLDTMGIPLGALEDPSSELYQKVSLDLLKGLPETFGSRIMKVEVDNFLKTIPSLLNSPSGRRMIASNMLKLGEMKEVYYNEMRRQQKDAIDSSKPLPKDFQQKVLDQVKPQIDRINNEFVLLSEIKSVPKGTVPFFYNGQIKFVPNEHVQWATETGGKRVW